MYQEFIYPVQIRERHLDTFGHVNNAKYLELYEEARWEIINSRGYDLKQIQKLNYWENNQAGSYELFLNNFNTLDEDVEKVQELLGYSYKIIPVNEAYENIFSWLGMVDVNGIIIISLMLMVAGVNMITALLILILDFANMIGLVNSM